MTNDELTDANVARVIESRRQYAVVVDQRTGVVVAVFRRT